VLFYAKCAIINLLPELTYYSRPMHRTEETLN